MFVKPKKESFNLKTVKTKDRASLDFEGSAMLSVDNESYEIPYLGLQPITPHPDLLNELDRLRVRLASFYGYTLFESLVNGSNFVASAAQKKYASQFTEQMISKITVNGISFSGKERDKIVIKGSYEGSAINTKPLHFSNPEYGEELQEICDKIEDEVYEYIFMNKKAQLDIFPEEDEDELN